MEPSLDFEFILPGRIIFGRGSVAGVGGEVKRLGGQRALIVTSPGMLKRRGLLRLSGSLRDLEIESLVYAGVDPEPSAEDVDDCSSLCREKACDTVIGLGGGGALDVAKKVAAELGLAKVMVPTTEGSGSEVTHEAVLRVEGKQQAFVDPSLTADVALVDPDLADTMPARLAALSGIEALAHAVECSDSRAGGPLITTLAQRASRLLQDNLRLAVERQTEARDNVALGSLLAGMAFGNSGTSLSHALAYPLSNLGTPHGEAVAAMLPYALEFNGFDRVTVARLRELISDLGITPRLVGDVTDLGMQAIQDTRHLANNPREVRLGDAVEIYRRAGRELGR